MSKELIEAVAAEMNRLGYGYHESHAESIVLAMAKAAPVGEREAFQCEERYTVIKHKDLTFDERAELDQLIHSRHIPTRECLVIESDWPEYEPAWRMIEARVTGAAQQPHSAEAVDMGSEWTPCVKLPVVVHVRQQRDGENHVSTREGITPIKPDDLIMRGVAGEEYPIGRELFERTYTFDTTPQPSAGVVMPDDIESLEASIDLIDRLQHSNMSVKELELANSEKNVLVNKVRKLLARLNGKEVGRG